MRQKTAEEKEVLTGSVDTSSSPTEAEIALRAYEIYLERGASDGHDLEDWLQAEIELSECNAALPLVRAASSR